MVRRDPSTKQGILAEPRVRNIDDSTLEGMSRSQRKSALHQLRGEVLARDVCRAGNELWAGRKIPPWERTIAKESKRSVEGERILECCLDFDCQTTAVRDSVPCGHEALSALARTPTAGYSGQGSGVPSAGRSKTIERGDIIKAQIDCIDLPDGSDSCSLRLCDLDELASHLPLGDASDLLLPVWEADHVLGYADPSLRAGRQLDELAAMLVMSGLCVPTTALVPVGIKLFCVAKHGDGGAKSQRLIWDCRAVSAMCKEPPKTAMGSIGALVDVELGTSDQKQYFGLCCTDLACFFYSLKGLIPGLERLCVLDGVSAERVRERLTELCSVAAALKRRGDATRFAHLPREEAAKVGAASDAKLEADNSRLAARFGTNYAERAAALLASWPAGATAVGCCAPPMGWSWSPYVAQSASTCLSKAACPQSLHVVHKGEQRKMEGSAVMTYLDDLGGIARGFTQRSAVVAAEELLAALKRKATDVGLVTHKDQCGREVLELGVQLRARDGTVVATPAPKKFLLLLRATRYLLTRRSVKKLAFLSVLGHWAWNLQLQRSQYSVLAECYRVTITTAANVTLNDRVHQELRWLCALAPMLRADLGSPLAPTMYMVDAGPEGGAFVSTRLTHGERYSPDVHLESYPRNVWRLGAMGTWKQLEHNNLCEARTNLWALQRAGNDEARTAKRRRRRARNVRVVVYTDSLVAKGAFTKGRSSSASLNRYCRKYAALAALLGVIGIFRYVESAKNWADGPSRGVRFPCVHHETAEKAERKLTRPRAHADDSGHVGSGAWSNLRRDTTSSSVAGSESDGEYHWQKSELGDALTGRKWKVSKAMKRQPLWRVGRDVARTIAAARSSQLS